jgi:hypothetical protein
MYSWEAKFGTKIVSAPFVSSVARFFTTENMKHTEPLPD